jgi:ribulose-phosphate 3-epimerase
MGRKNRQLPGIGSNSRIRMQGEGPVEKLVYYLGADHGGYHLKEQLKDWLRESGVPFHDEGNDRLEPEDDYPFYALAVAKALAMARRRGEPAFGILVCRSAAGMVIVANKIAGIRAVAALDVETAHLARAKNDANLLVLASDFVSADSNRRILAAWLQTEFCGEERHLRRVEEIERLERAVVDVIPGLLEEDLTAIDTKLKLVEPFVPWVQIDLADGDLVPNRSFTDLAALAQLHSPTNLELHMMVRHPLKFLAPGLEGGVKRFLAQVEGEEIGTFLQECRRCNVEVGLALGMRSPVEMVKPWLDQVDEILVMSVQEGFSGQNFQRDALGKILELRREYPTLPIAVDGGINPQTAALAAMAGAQRLVATSALFGHPPLEQAIRRLRNLTGDGL